MIRINMTKAVADTIVSLPNAGDKDRILKGIGDAAMNEWQRLARTGLRSTSRQYVESIQRIDTAGKVKLVLTGTLPNMLENGWPGGDMRAWMLRSSKAKMGPNGPYLTIPFAHGSSGTKGRNVGPEMPGAIYQAAKKLTATVSRPGPGVGGSPGKTTVWGQRLHEGLRSVGSDARKILQTKMKEHHTTSIYTGMVRKATRTASGRMQTTGYNTFRRISMKKNSPESWVMPKMIGKKYAVQVQKYVAEVAGSLVKAGIR